MDLEEEQSENRPKKSPRVKTVVAALVAVVVVVGLASAVAMNQMSKNPAFCGSCHIIKPYYQSWKSGTLLAAGHAAKGVSCLDCHHKGYLAKAEEGIRYITGSYQKPLKEITFTREQCLQCHKDFEKVIAATDFEQSNPHDSHLGEIDCTLCHKMHRQSEVYCAQCHEFTWFKELGSGWKTEAAQS